MSKKELNFYKRCYLWIMADKDFGSMMDMLQDYTRTPKQNLNKSKVIGAMLQGKKLKQIVKIALS